MIINKVLTFWQLWSIGSTGVDLGWVILTSSFPHSKRAHSLATNVFINPKINICSSHENSKNTRKKKIHIKKFYTKILTQILKIFYISTFIKISQDRLPEDSSFPSSLNPLVKLPFYSSLLIFNLKPTAAVWKEHFTRGWYLYKLCFHVDKLLMFLNKLTAADWGLSCTGSVVLLVTYCKSVLTNMLLMSYSMKMAEHKVHDWNTTGWI